MIKSFQLITSFDILDHLNNDIQSYIDYSLFNAMFLFVLICVINQITELIAAITAPWVDWNWRHRQILRH